MLFFLNRALFCFGFTPWGFDVAPYYADFAPFCSIIARLGSNWTFISFRTFQLTVKPLYCIIQATDFGQQISWFWSTNLKPKLKFLQAGFWLYSENPCGSVLFMRGTTCRTQNRPKSGPMGFKRPGFESSHPDHLKSLKLQWFQVFSLFWTKLGV